MNMTLIGKQLVCATSFIDGETVEFCFKGQAAKTLLTLLEAGSSGVTSQDVPRGFRLAAYVHLLKKHGIVIVTHRLKTPSGWVGRYVLKSEINVTASEWDA